MPFSNNPLDDANALPEAVPRQRTSPPIPWKVWIIVFMVAGAIGAFELYMVKTSHKIVKRSLPVLAKVPDFSFTTEAGLPLTKNDLLGKIWVADFIFTRCAGPCPMMTERMLQMQVDTRYIAGGDVHLISVTVDPAYDTPEVLSKYGAKYGTNPDRWSFLTGDPATVENFISKGMLLGLSKDGAGMPVHSEKFAIVDREGYIRAYHDLDTEEVLMPKVIADIQALDRESHTPLPGRGKDK